MPYLALAARVLLGVVFLVSAASKLRGPAAFAASIGPIHLVRNAALIAVAAGGAVATVSGGTPQPGGLVVAIAAGLLAGGLVTSIDDIRLLFQPHPTIT